MSGSAASDEAVLVILPISHFCEKARWALDRFGVKFRVEAHAPGFHVPAVKGMGLSSTTTPVLRLPDGRVLGDSSLIVRHCDVLAQAANVERLFPPEQPDVEELCARFDTLGADARAVVYAHALSSAELRRAAAAPPVPPGERRAWHYTGLSWFVTQVIMKNAFRVSAKNGAAALERIRSTFAEVGTMLGGRKYLCGDAFTAADLTFVALAAPVLGIPYGAIPAGQRPFEMGEKPAALAAAEAELRETAAGRYALRVWAEQRDVCIIAETKA